MGSNGSGKKRKDKITYKKYNKGDCVEMVVHLPTAVW